jgi:lauroyl/myristoyl acyltransferase
MTPGPGAGPRSARTGAWHRTGADWRRRSRPPRYSAGAWAAMHVLDLLPWPWGEDLMACGFIVKGIVRSSRLRAALKWASAQPGSRGPGRWRLAMALCAHHGLAVARSAAVGLRDPESLRSSVAVRGAEHLGARSGGAILLGFHLGMPNGDVMLRLMGHRARWLGGGREAGGWARAVWQPFLDTSGELVLDEPGARGGVLRRACRALLDGEIVCMTADGGAGREAFRLPLPGGPLIVRSGWLSLREHGRAAVLPVLTHREGRTEVVTIHPPLPADVGACWAVLLRLLQDYVRRFPAQCYRLAFGPTVEARVVSGDKPEPDRPTEAASSQGRTAGECRPRS